MSHTLLLADDSAAIHRVIALTFADQPIDVVAVADGAAALARIQAEPPDIVLADVAMPGLDGYQLCTRIKGTPGLAHIPVVLLTGAFDAVDEAKAGAAGCDAVLAKPFEPQLVVRRVLELLAHRPPVTAQPAARTVPAPPAQTPPAAAAPVPAPPPVAAPPVAPPAASVPPPPAPADASRLQSPALDEYFERLDATLSALSAGGRSLPPVEPAAPDFGGEPEPPEAAGAFDFPDFGATFGSPEAAGGRPFEDVGMRLPGGERDAAGGPSMAEAFAAMLDAERPHGRPQPDTAIDDRLVEEIVTRVVHRLADQGVRDVIADIVSRVAERAVREEIARLKASL